VSPRLNDVLELDNTPPTLQLPAPITVYATETAGAHVTFPVTATDNFPGPVPFSCDHASGELFPNGKNAPKTTTVTCTAHDSVENSATASFTITVVSPFGYVNDFVVLGIDWATIGSGSVVQTGNVGAFDHSAGAPSRDGFEFVAGPSAVLLGGVQIAAESDRLEASTSAGDAFYVDTLFLGNGATATGKKGYVPLFLGLPAVAPPGAGGSDVSVSSTTTLAPGSYGALSVKSNVVATLAGGSYSFASIELKPGAQLRFAAPATIVVAGRTLLANGSAAAPVAGVTPKDVVLYVHGLDGPPNNPADAFRAGSGVTLGADVYVPNGTLTIGGSTVATGAFIGRRVSVGGGATLVRSSSFLLS
jgi:hypothetical protein